MKKLEVNESKLLIGLACLFRKPNLANLRMGNLPPKTWVPNRAKMPRNKKRRRRSDTMASMLLISEARRFCNDLQYLEREELG